jgi:hypothetical protein
MAAGTSIGALVLAQVISQPVAASVLFVVFLFGLFALLAVVVIASDQWVQGIWASPEQWPRWVERRRLIRFLLRSVRFLLRSVRFLLRSVRTALNAVARQIRAAVAQLSDRLRKELTREAIRRHARATLDALGLPLDEPAVTPDSTAALEHAVSTRRVVAHHQRVDVDEHRRTFLPAEYRVTRDALEKACQGAKERSATLEPRHAPPLPEPEDASAPVRISSTVRMVSHQPQPDRGSLERAFAAKRARAAREALKHAGHTALVAAMGILPDRTGSTSTR